MVPMARIATALRTFAICLAGCSSEPQALTEGAVWLTRVPPLKLRERVETYEETQQFGERNDAHAWRAVTRYTVRRDVDGQDAGCSFIGWIPGTWSVKGSTLTVTTSAADSGSLERHRCPSRDAVQTVVQTHFVRAESPFRLDGSALRIENRFGEAPGDAVTLTREN
jgi:hypothetical protein